MTDARTKTRSELRRFGVVLSTAFAVFGGLALWRGRPIGPYLLVVAVALGLLALVTPAWLRPVERAWTALGERMALVSTTAILTVTFFVVITPLAVIRRLLGADDLGLRFDRRKPSYWTPVDPDGPAGRPDKPY